MSLSAKSQCLVALEVDEGVAETLVSADIIEVLADTFPNVASNNEAIPRNVARGTLSKLPPVPGGRDGSVSLQMEMAGPKTTSAWTNSNPAGFGLLLRACGMREIVATKMAITSIATDDIYHWDTLTSNSTSTVVRLLGDYYIGEDLYIFWEMVTDNTIINLDVTWTSVTGTGVVTAPSPVATGNMIDAIVYLPIDDEISSIAHDSAGTGLYVVGSIITQAVTGAKAEVWGGELNSATAGDLHIRILTGSALFDGTNLLNGGGPSTAAAATAVATQLHNPSISIETRHGGPRRRIKGARGNWSLDVKNKDRPMFTFEFSGAGLSPGDVVPAVFGSGISNQIPPTTVGSVMLFDGTFAPLYGDMAYQSNNELTLRDSPTDSSASGYLSNRIVNRAPTITLESESVRQQVYNFPGKDYAKTEFRSVQKFTSTIPGNSFEIRTRGLSVNEHSLSDKDGILADNVTLACNSRGVVLNGSGNEIGKFFDDEIIIYQY